MAALAQWSDISAAEELYRISENPANAEYLDRALRGFVRVQVRTAMVKWLPS